MPPKLILIRHGEAQHNATNKFPLPYIPLSSSKNKTNLQAQDYKIHDPLLTETGHEQCAKLNAYLMEHEPLAKEIELVVCSPMKRTIQTMEVGLKGVLERGVRVEMDALWQGMCLV